MGQKSTQREGPTTIRLTFAVDGDKLELKNARRLSIRAPAGEPLDTDKRANRVGGWVEVRGSDDEVLYRRRMQQVVRKDVEVSEGGEGGTFRRVAGGSSGLVHVFVPSIDGAWTVALCEGRPGTGDGQRPDVVEHATVPLAKLDIDGIDDEEKRDTDGGDDAHTSEER